MSVLSEAEALIYGDREKNYGDPGRNIRRIAKLWEVALDGVLKEGVKLEEHHVCLCMALVKLARLVHTPTHHDSQTDVCGYTALLERIQHVLANKGGVVPGHCKGVAVSKGLANNRREVDRRRARKSKSGARPSQVAAFKAS